MGTHSASPSTFMYVWNLLSYKVKKVFIIRLLYRKKFIHSGDTQNTEKKLNFNEKKIKKRKLW